MTYEEERKARLVVAITSAMIAYEDATYVEMRSLRTAKDGAWKADVKEMCHAILAELEH